MPGIAFICQEVLDLNMAGTHVRPSRDSNPQPPDKTAETLTTEQWRLTVIVLLSLFGYLFVLVVVVLLLDIFVPCIDMFIHV